MELRLYHHPRCLYHENLPGHPERPERVRAILRTVEGSSYPVPVSLREAPPANRADLERVHDPAYVERVAASRDRGRTVFDADTSAGEHSYEAALLAAGGALAAVRAAVSGQEAYSFVATRPPGHHAESDHAMGFCLFNNVAVAAADALASGLERVAIVDWDVHHGNGTQHIFASRSDVLYVSLHQSPHYPGTGTSSEIGTGDGEGYTMNLPLPAGSAEAEYLACFDELILPVLEQYRPQLVLVSAGFDADRRDPLAGMMLDHDAYEAITERLRTFADATADGRIVHLLEGGYDLEALSDGVDAVLRVLARDRDGSRRVRAAEHEREHDEGVDVGYASRGAAAARAETRSALREHWSLGPH
jgi:acetoin utilization deacetylase AcuC-like enzyme